MNFRRLLTSKLLAMVLCFSMVNLTVPYGAFLPTNVAKPGAGSHKVPMLLDAVYERADLESLVLSVSYLSTGLFVWLGTVEDSETPIGGIFEEMRFLAKDKELERQAALAEKPEPEKPAAVSRFLTAQEMRTLRGTYGQNPYIAGGKKWDVSFNGINVLNGNFSTSATDLSFEGGYGIPVNVTRSYSSNNPEEGPLGVGWNLSVDIRTTAGGLLKSSGAPVRSVPVMMKERPLAQADDPNLEITPAEAVVATDAGGMEETIQKDVDGILTTPPWDKNTMRPQYEFRDGAQILVSQTVNTPEGTVYTYAKKGYYDDGGAYPMGEPEGDRTPSNVLKITTAVDRHGNITTYTYGSGTVEFDKYNGTTVENKLESISMPNGHEIEFTWGNGTSTPADRIVSTTDGDRTVAYTYSSGMLATATSPGGKVTTYGYDAAADYENDPDEYTCPGNLLTSITDPRGLATTISYAMGNAPVDPYNVWMPAPVAYKIVHPNGVTSYFHLAGVWAVYESGSPSGPPLTCRSEFYNYVGGARKTYTAIAVLQPDGSHTTSFKVRVGRDDNVGITSGDEFSWEDDIAVGAQWAKTYHILSQDLLDDSTYIYPRTVPNGGSDLTDDRKMALAPFYAQRVKSTTTYNFMGNPLSKSVYQATYDDAYLNPVSGSYTTTNVDYAYHGKSKYYQQKAVRSQTGSSTYRCSFTEYFDDQATTGKKGQVYRVYDDKNANFDNVTGSTWRNDIAVNSSYTSKYSAEFDYDSKGRPIDVWKLQKIVSGTFNYVQTHTTYGADNTPWWGAPTTVVEDYGSGKINRTTETLTYDSAGRATEVEDAAGKVFLTVYNDDGQVESVTRTDTTPDQPIVTYTYGSSGITNGMVTQVVDEIYGVTQDFTYSSASDGSKGQVIGVDESRTGTSYGVDYTYNNMGERETATYDMPNGDSRWKYSDYIQAGNPASPSRVFQTMNRQSWSGSAWVDSTEEFHYGYDSSGRLHDAAFAQTPQSGQSTYSASYPADVRARAWYKYDASGRIFSIEHWWDDWGTSSYTSTAILGADYTYDAYKGLRTAAQFKIKNPGTPSAFMSDPAWSAAESYGYDADLDYLTDVDYNDGVSNEAQTWTYDAAGNRASDSTLSGGGSWTYDNLNRMYNGGGYGHENDILGNRTWRNYTDPGVRKYNWDAVNRLESTAGEDSGSGAAYKYRADGMRIQKVDGLYLQLLEDPETKSGYYDEIWGTDNPTTRYFYDGQMSVEEDYTRIVEENEVVDVTRYGIGARGIDMIAKDPYNAAETKYYPIYDGHGNNVGLVTRNGTGFTVSNRRAYDAWGIVRQGSTSGEPFQRYCANLGHVQDDESGLTYMRARYYEPWTGRFVSEDPSRDGVNWFSYADSNPLSHADQNGREAAPVEWLRNLLKQFGPLGEAIYNAILGVVGAGVGAIVVAMNLLASKLIKQGNLEAMYGFSLLAMTRGGSLASLLGTIGLSFVRTGVQKIAMGWMLRIASFILAEMYGDAITEGGLF